MAADIVYCIDTSSIIRWYVEIYPPTIFPALQARIEGLIAAGRMRAPKAVLDEIRPGDDCHTWAKGQGALFVEESVAVQAIVRQLMATHHDPAKPLKGINGADPFVIAMAMANGAQWAVVADEHPGSRDNRKIPFVCQAETVRCISFQQMMLAEGWRF
ncbi:MAG TPA: DUF4411 family protein [Stellaceae bacterium]|nr:DUF4411 family protein [Stellaceae bacterium]